MAKNGHHDMQILTNPRQPCPTEILKQQVALEVKYLDFEGNVHVGILEINESVSDNVKTFFDYAFILNFPINKIARASDAAYQWDDANLIGDNITSGFNYRMIAGTDELSPHSMGLAFDINPRQNPYIRYVNGKEIVAPEGAIWQPNKVGTLYAEHPLVLFMIERGWEWGGNWSVESGRIDYQHFQNSK